MNITLDVATIKALFGFRQQYCEFLIVILRGLFACETVSLSKLSHFLGYKHSQSAYKRLQRFIDKVSFCSKALAKVFATFSGLDKIPKWVVILDRTYWMFGKTHLTFLYMGVSTGRYCIPLFFILLGPNKKGNSSFAERKKLLDLFLEVFGKERIAYLIGDREFIGKAWLTYLQFLQIPFSQRIREKNQTIANSQGEMVKAFLLFEHLKPGEILCLGRRKMGVKDGVTGDIWGLRNDKGDLVIIISFSLEDPLLCYKNRWQIEICFRSLKSNGFHIEDSHVSQPHRIVCLLNIASLAFVFCVSIGEYLNTIKPIKLKKHGYPQSSMVRYALDHIKGWVLKSLRSLFKAKKPLSFKWLKKFVL